MSTWEVLIVSGGGPGWISLQGVCSFMAAISLLFFQALEKSVDVISKSL